MWFRLRFSAESSFLCSTWVKSRFCSWRGIEGTGKAWPLMPEERKSPACRCLDSWDASTTSCPMRPSGHWPSSPQVRQKRPLHILSTTLMNPFNCCPHPFTVIISAFCFSFFSLSQKLRVSLCTHSWLRGSSPCLTTSCSTWRALKWALLKSRTSVSLTSNLSSSFLTSAQST